MTIHEVSPFSASITRLPGGTVGILTVTKCPSAPAAAPEAGRAAKKVTKRFFNIILDNSGSMGEHTKAALDAIVRPMLQRAWFDGTLVTLFDDASQTERLECEADLNGLLRRLPRQGRTNITQAVLDNMGHLQGLIEADAHVITMLLTDGGHNEGRPLTALVAKECCEKLTKNAPAFNHTVLAFCLTNQSDATASMIVKEVFENAKIGDLPNVFYAATHGAMKDAIGEVVVACDVLFEGHDAAFAAVQLPDGTEFIANGSENMKARFEPMKPQTFVVTLKPTTDDVAATSDQWIAIDGHRIPVTVRAVGSEGTSLALAAVRDALQPLTRQAVAFDLRAIEKRLVSLETLVAAIDALAAAEKQKYSSGTADGATPAARRATLKRLVTAQYGMHEIRNALAALRVKQRSNSDSISLLTGNQRKFAHVASKRSQTEHRTAKDVADDTYRLGQELLSMVQMDLAVATANGIDLDAELPTSAITLQTNAEQLRQWAEAFEECGPLPGQTMDEAIMDVMSAYGLAAFPVRLVTTDATQVDTMQLAVSDICAQMADSASMMMSWRMNNPIKFADGNSYTELLLLVDPALPTSSAHVLANSMLVQHLMSAMVSKDLYMFLPGMHASMHTHAYVAAVEKAFSIGAAKGAGPVESFLKLAIHIVYSTRKLWANGVIFEDMGNFERWLMHLQSVTRCQADQVFHPAALSMKLAFTTFDINEVDERTALLNQFNEQLSRRIGFATDGFPTRSAFAHELFGIVEEDAPRPLADVLASEPAEDVIRSQCPKHIPAGCVGGCGRALAKLGTASVRDYVESEWLPLFRVHQVSTALHYVLRERGLTMDTFCSYIEAHLAIPDDLVLAVQRRLTLTCVAGAAAMWEYLGIDKKSVDAVCAAAVMQACLYPSSQDRVGVVNTKDVTDPAEQRTMIEDLYMLHYKVACGFKSHERSQIIGGISALQASKVELDVFSDMIGVHTHGHCRQIFWGMMQGLLADPKYERMRQKLELFRAKSSAPGFDAVIKKASGGGGRKRH